MKLYYPEGMRMHGENALKFMDFERYDPIEDIEKPAMFWLYFQEDYEYFSEHRGKNFVFWHNTDVIRLTRYNEFQKYLPALRNPGVIHACHNSLLRDELSEVGIHALIRPVFWNDLNKYKHSKNLTKDCYITSHVMREQEYGEWLMWALARDEELKDWRFHIFGTQNNDPKPKNLIYHGQVPENEMDKTTKNFRLCLRMNVHDGFSQTAMKALLRGHRLITFIDYPKIPTAKTYTELVMWINTLYEQENWLKTCDTFIQLLNNFDWLL